MMTRLDRLLALVALAFVLALCMPAQACAPAQAKDGTGTRAVFEFNSTGAAIGWWCPGRSTARMYAVRWAGLTQPLHEGVLAMRDAVNAQDGTVDVSSAIAALANANTNTPMAELRDVWGPLEARLAATRPPEAAWIVAEAPSNASPPDTRPTYLYTPTAGVGGVDGGRIREGEPCNCALVSVTNVRTTWCSVQGLLSKVAVCVRR
jgi:hypothetical protein